MAVSVGTEEWACQSWMTFWKDILIVAVFVWGWKDQEAINFLFVGIS